MNTVKKSTFIWLIVLVSELILGFYFLRENMMPALRWWLMFVLLGLGALPFCARLFSSFSDKGYLFAKLLGGLAGAWCMWLLASLRLMPFSTVSVIVVTLICLALMWASAFLPNDKRLSLTDFPGLSEILSREAIFAGAFFFFCYVKCYNPDAYGTERMMDYGFMQSIFRTEFFPPQDFWFAGESLNYYYFGQYFMTFFTKLSFNSVAYGYNLALCTCFAFCVSFSFSLVYQWIRGRFGKKKSGAWPVAVFGGLVLSCSASVHYLIFNFLVPWIWDILVIPGDKPSYWYADSTRYIGYHPETADKTAHEYPAYSFLLGDLHAHVINIFVVMTILALLYAWVKSESREEEEEDVNALLSFLRDPKLWTLGFLLGISMMENFWDFPIYFVVAGAVLLTLHLRSGKSARFVAEVTALQGISVLLTAFLVSLPFQLNFTAMANGLRIAQNHTPIYQLAILWALPLGLAAAFFAAQASRSSGHGLRERLRSLEGTDLYVMLLGLCGAGLVLLPELIYLADIYSGDYKRFNTMFKLSYQAFILLNLVAVYVVGSFVLHPQSKEQRKGGIKAGIVLLLCCGYFLTAMKMSAGDITDAVTFRGLAADDFLEREAPMDAEAVYWARENLPDGSVLLEANGSSYTIYNRASVITGLPTVLGWHTHEWLWHNDLTPVDERAELVKRMYVQADAALMREYDVDYIFLGSCEYEKYDKEGMDAAELCALGEVVFTGKPDGTGRSCYIIKLN
ncbi:MAG: hypothetical protein K5697_03865 [Lachnospiraceae bacterium]|nr:hypothetical protein [Lachnospiraceae bacterium]